MKKNKKKKRKVLSIIERNIIHILPSPSHKSITSILYYYLSLIIKMAKFFVTGVLGGIAYLIATTSKEEDIYRDKFRNLVRSMKGSNMNKFYSIMRSKKDSPWISHNLDNDVLFSFLKLMFGMAYGGMHWPWKYVVQWFPMYILVWFGYGCGDLAQWL